ncbi:MAG: hypothetical protein R3C59_18015 [Planctomycetaceae bacterium]
MSTVAYQKDLVVLAADKCMQHALQSLLARHDALGTRSFPSKVFVHPQNDSAVRSQSPQFLRPHQQRYERAVAIFDYEGSGAESVSAAVLESEIEAALSRNGWDNRSRVVVIEPELEAWVWSPSPNVDRVLGWEGRIPSLRQWLVEQNLLDSIEAKPQRPKEAMEAAMAESEKRWSSAVFRQLGQRVSFSNCRDRSFLRLVSCLQEWFPA